MTTKLARWSLDRTVHSLFKDSNGGWVRHKEHAEMVAALEAENKQLRRQVGAAFKPHKGSASSVIFAYMRAAPPLSTFTAETLAEECDATFGTARQGLLRLVGRGLVEKVPHLHGQYRLTDAGRAWVDPGAPQHVRALR